MPADPAPPPFVRLDAAGVTLLLDLRSGQAGILYFGPALGADTTPESVADALVRSIPPSAPSVELRIALTPLMATGHVGIPGLSGHRDGRSFAPLPRLRNVTVEGQSVTLHAIDDANALALDQMLLLDPQSGVLRATSAITNQGDEPYTLDHLAAPCFPLPSWAVDHIAFTGRWAGEFMTTRERIPPGVTMRQNRRGRTSHDCFPGAIVLSADASARHGEAMAFHLGWSGNHVHHIERLADGRGVVSFGELLLPGECRLAAGETYRTPVLFVAVDDGGTNAVAKRLHGHVRNAVLPASVATRPRPVHYNSWEAVYFDHDPAVLAELVDRAAALGVERFVLDDGWFGARRSDAAGLGDWTVSETVYPDGLGPLIDHVQSRGMAFGLWIEPEMVNPDSDLFRARPDWVLSLPGVAPVPARNQYVLDLSIAAVADHLFAAIDTLLRRYPIDYLKWDMNRDINHPGNGKGRASAHAQVTALYALIDRVRAAHPAVEIESCASGGGRADYAMLARTHRIWTSDSNDAIDRLRIQRGAAHFLPAEVLGSHVGPRDCHITGRRIDMAMRAGVAIFGHMGLEMDLRELSDAEAATLAAAIALHKRHRALIHSGDRVQIDMPPERDAFGIVAPDRGEALFSYALLDGHPATLPGRLRFDGLDPARAYRMEQVWPVDASPASRSMTGDALMRSGIELRLMKPQSVMIWHLIERTE